ncbi:hypothetical protein BC938DRAFT_470551 [Jimgerdemannia flammicorona]|uniref:Uncharacterized protein n=1 Tax=Jimgerdemannia flammicorona TaxID=994334 RepID=A0A433Q9X1_9FUNG|nr:hypothetical protein BC938DRAFT_470551 [Jimgerdemannia flammicorona]
MSQSKRRCGEDCYVVHAITPPRWSVRRRSDSLRPQTCIARLPAENALFKTAFHSIENNSRVHKNCFTFGQDFLLKYYTALSTKNFSDSTEHDK